MNTVTVENDANPHYFEGISPWYTYKNVFSMKTIEAIHLSKNH